MSIRCKHCDERVPEWDSYDGSCPCCYEQYERTNEHAGISAEEELTYECK